jgi:hypothetical protein
VKDATFIVVIFILAVCLLFRTGEQPKLAVTQASAPCWFVKHPDKPLRRWA